MSQLRPSEIISRSFSILFENFVPFILLTALVYTPFIALSVIIYGVDRAGAEPGALALLAAGPVMLMIVLNLLATGALMYGVIRHLHGQRVTLGACLNVGIQRLMAVLGVGLLVGLCVLGGVFLFIVPGIIMSLMLYVAVPVAVIEQPGVSAALRRSAELTRGHKGSIFAVVLLVALINFGANMVIGGVQAVAPEALGLLLDLGSSVFFGAFGAVVTAVVYFDLRVMQDGVDAAQLARSFE
ncbi:hypothetical protein [Haliangium sp.]|uniref:hypothetical protein n=1 Tax=Haliangium sp. TaxID=2663208 RepID=UPI003D0CBA70